MLSLLQSSEMDLDEDRPDQAQDLVIDEEQKLKAQLKLFEESGLEGKKVILPPENITNTGENDEQDKSKSELSKPDGSKINESNIRENNENQVSSITKDQNNDIQNLTKDIPETDKVSENETIATPKEPRKIQKGEFITLESTKKEETKTPSPSILGSINLNKAQAPSNKFNELFDTPEKSPRKSLEPLKKQPSVEEYGDDDEDPLDAFMKTIKDDAAVQDDLGMNEDEDEDKPIQNVISFEDLANMHNDYTESNVEPSNIDSDDEMEIDKGGKVDEIDDDKYHEQFIAKLRKEKAAAEQERFFADEDEFVEDIAKNKELGNDDYLERQKKATEKRELLLSSKMQRRGQLEHLTKNFYIEPKEISDMTEEEVENYRKALGEVAVRGVQCPRPIKSWYHCGLSQRILAVLQKKGFEGPRPIQCQAIPAIMGGRDVIGIAETGSGKTLAYLLPMFRHILNQRSLKEGEGMIGLIMAPTRELAQQIYYEARSFTRVMNLNVV